MTINVHQESLLKKSIHMNIIVTINTGFFVCCTNAIWNIKSDWEKSMLPSKHLKHWMLMLGNYAKISIVFCISSLFLVQ